MATPDLIAALVVTSTARSKRPITGTPALSSATADLSVEIEVVDERGDFQIIAIPRERPLTIWLDGRELVTLMTLGGAPEWLVVGYLRNQRLVTDVTALASIDIDWASGAAQVHSNNPAHMSDRDPASAACALGTAFNDLLLCLDNIQLPSFEAARITRVDVLKILETMRSHDDIHRAAGSVHSCAVFQASELLIAVEDVSRHNGVDTITGWMVLHGLSGADKILFTTGRLTAEMVMKAAFNGIPILVTRNGVTAMGRDLALRLGMTLLGRAAGRRYLCYSGSQRLDADF